MKAFDFIDRVIKEVKYKPRHEEIRCELRSHIEELTEQCERFNGVTAEETAVSYMGDAQELGRKINNQYRMPFNNTYGIAIWSFINTMLIYALYPIWIYIWNRYPTKITYAVIVPVIYIILNVFYLKRGHFKFALRDWRDILFGTLAGAAVSIGCLLIVSYFFQFGYYPYGALCKIPIKWEPYNYDMPMILFNFWLWWMIYMVSLGKPKKSKGEGIYLYRPDLLSHVSVGVSDDEDNRNDTWWDIFGEK